MTEQDLTIIEQRLAHATTGEWLMEWLDCECAAVNAPHADIYTVTEGEPCNVACATFSPADASFVAHAKSDITRLIAEVRRLQAEVETTRQDAVREVEKIGNTHPNESVQRACITLASRLRRLPLMEDRL